MWVAVPEPAGGGDGWVPTSSSIDPQSYGWESVGASEVLDYVDRGRDGIAALTTQILSSCLAEGFGREALVLAEALMVHGYDIVVTVASVTPTADRIRTTGVAGGEPITITAPEQRTYSLVFRYANGTGGLYHHRRL